jgi:hypothetical protein
VEAVRVRKAHHSERRRLGHLTGDLDCRLAEVELGLTGRVGERDEDLLAVALVPGDGFLDLGDAAVIAGLIAQTLKDALGRVMPLGRRVAVGGQDLFDHSQEGPSLILERGALLR